MDVDDEKTPAGDVVFRKQFSQASEGSHQYKIRIGEDHWILDESKETGIAAKARIFVLPTDSV